MTAGAAAKAAVLADNSRTAAISFLMLVLQNMDCSVFAKISILDFLQNNDLLSLMGGFSTTNQTKVLDLIEFLQNNSHVLNIFLREKFFDKFVKLDQMLWNFMHNSDCIFKKILEDMLCILTTNHSDTEKIMSNIATLLADASKVPD